jgi:hypothetical protein
VPALDYARCAYASRPQDAELDQFRNGVSCAAVLERLPPAWRLDPKGSTRRALKYRRGEGEVVIVNHDGRGWWDPLSSTKGDIFDLVQFLDPSLNFGQVRKRLRPLVGLVAPTYPGSPSCRKREPDPIDHYRHDGTNVLGCAKVRRFGVT